MDMNTILTLITGVGFPIVAYLLMFNYLMKKDEMHKTEMQGLTNALENNTLVMQKLLDEIEEKGE